MTESSFSSNSNNLFSNLFYFCFSIFSHPLYFSYFLFFSPYLYRLLSFLSPLFITTTLLLLVAILTFTPKHFREKVSASEISESKLDSLLAWLLSKAKANDRDDETGYLDEFEAYLATFQASIFEAIDPKPVEDGSEGSELSFADCSSGEGGEDFATSDEIVDKAVVTVEVTKPNAEVKRLETLFQDNAELEVKPLYPECNKVEESEPKSPLRNGSKYAKKAIGNNRDILEYGSAAPAKARSRRLEANLGSPDRNLGGFGSMRVEKEWRRTLACKLFEERHNKNNNNNDAEGIVEGMDMLWETQETESSNSKKGKKTEAAERYGEDEEEEEDEELDQGKLCCLQALKFSAGKMSLGMGRPNLVKFSKAIKGIGWLHHVGRHGGKKGGK